MYKHILLFSILYKIVLSDIPIEDIQFLNELPLDKLIRLKTSLQDFTVNNYENVTDSTPFLQSFGAQAMAIKAPIRRTDYDDGIRKKESKISNIFSMSVTTLAFLAFGGYLLCLIVQAVKAKQNNPSYAPPQPTTFFVSSGYKKKPLQSQFQTQFQSSYGRKRRDDRIVKSFRQIDLPPEQLFDALLLLCEGYVKWSDGFV